MGAPQARLRRTYRNVELARHRGQRQPVEVVQDSKMWRSSTDRRANAARIDMVSRLPPA